MVAISFINSFTALSHIENIPCFATDVGLVKASKSQHTRTVQFITVGDKKHSATQLAGECFLVLPAGMFSALLRTLAPEPVGSTIHKNYKITHQQKLMCYFGTPCGNRTHNGPLGGDCYIHLTKEA